MELVDHHIREKATQVRLLTIPSNYIMGDHTSELVDHNIR